ncbi:MAG: DUF1189 family protein [bacterium]
MAPSYPNHLKSIPRSIGSLKHYFDVHDQPFARSALYVVILALLITVVGLLVSFVGIVREAGRWAEDLEAELAGVSLEDGQLTAEGEQPRILWEDIRTVSVPTKAEDGTPVQEERTVRQMVVVLDTTGQLETLEQAADFAGCAEPARYVFFGTEQIETVRPPQSRGEQPEEKTIPYSDAEKVNELKILVEENGAAMPAITVEDGTASFDLPPDQVHVLVRNAELMALVDTSGEKRSMSEAVGTAFNEDPSFRAKVERPEFLVFLGAEQAAVKPVFARETTTWTFAEGEDVTAASLADWVAAKARGARVKALLQQIFPWFLYGLIFLFIGSLICSVAGLIVNGMLRAGLAYGEVLTIAAYAITPGLAAFLLAVIALQGRGSPWVLALAVIIGMIYTALGTHRTARLLDEETAPSV